MKKWAKAIIWFYSWQIMDLAYHLVYFYTHKIPKPNPSFTAIVLELFIILTPMVIFKDDEEKENKRFQK